MSNESNKLRSMINSADEEADNIDISIDSIDKQIDELQEKFDAIKNGIMTPASNDLIAYLDSTKIDELNIIYNDCTLIIGIQYNDINVTDWEIRDSTGNTVYKYIGIGWDNDSNILNFKNKWDFGYDYLYHPLGTSGTYGIQPMIDALNNGKSTLTANKNTIINSKDVFEDYAT